MCASIQANVLYLATKLGFINEQTDMLAEMLMLWQWDDGGWNCDKNPSAKTSTFIHTFYGMRALYLYGLIKNDMKMIDCAKKAASYILDRKLFRRLTNNEIVKKEYTVLHYPLYWHYDILGALKGFSEIGIVNNPRFKEALDLLESKRLECGGWAAEAKYYTVSSEKKRNADYVDWGPVSKNKYNEWITVDALYVLKKMGRSIN